MANPVCLSPLKFYDSLKKQERYKSYAYGNISPVIMPFNVLYPFQFVLNSKDSHIIDAFICDAKINSKVGGSIMSQLNDDGLAHKDINGFRVVMFPGLFPLQSIENEGEYYLELHSDNKNIYYSEVFCFTNALDGYLELEYWNPESDFYIKNGIITFANNFRFKILIRSELGKPEYSFEEEATKRLGYNFIESQVSKKIYKFNAVLPEYLCDALRVIRLCSNKTLANKGEIYEMLTFEMDVGWQDQGDLASVSCEFEVDNIIANLGGFEYENHTNTDFDNSYNNDFNTNAVIGFRDFDNSFNNDFNI